MNEEKKNYTWVKLYRKSLESSVWKNSNTWMVWSWCLMKANHKTHKFAFNGKDIEIKSGSFITGIKKATTEMPITIQTYRTCIAYLKSTGRITTKSTNQFTIIYIDKWEEYQSKLTNESTQELTNQQQTTNKPLTTYKNVKNDKNDKNNNKQPAVAERKDKDIFDLIELFKNVNPSYTRFYADKTQRACLARLLKIMGEEKLKRTIALLQQTNGMDYAPTITTPFELEKKLGSLIAFVKKQDNKKLKVIKIK